MKKVTRDTLNEIQKLLDSGWDGKDGRYSFMTAMYQREDMDFQDIARMSQAMVEDGLITVRHFVP